MIFLNKLKSMIKITPAILTSDLDEFVTKFNEYIELFGLLDIDIAEESFAENNTISLIDVIDSGILSETLDIGIHLMVSDPINKLKYMVDNGLKDFSNLRIYVHQESELSKLDEYTKYFKIGVVVKRESTLKDLSFYERFGEVQLMTIDIGKQGNSFYNDSLKRVKQLRDLGFRGDISLDGGVNLDTASLIRDVNPDRVSVGSYFQNSSDLVSDFNKLDNILNK